MAKKNRDGYLERKPKFAKRITIEGGKRVWKRYDGKEYDTKREYFSENKE